MSEEVTGQVRAWSAQSAAVAFAMDHMDEIAPGWTFRVQDHATGEITMWRLNDEGDVVPCEPR